MNLLSHLVENDLKKTVLTASVVAFTLSACVVEPPRAQRVVYVQQQPATEIIYEQPAPQPVVSVYVEPPLYQPPPVRVAWAPPAMLVEIPPPQPYDGAVWTGGYWVWEGNWIWAHGRWAPPPQPDYSWVHPYYENRGGSVIFVNGFWAAPGVRFVAPSVSLNIAFAAVAVGVVAGPRPIGPEGCFVPPPPGSRFGLIVPAPIGTPPAVVVGAPPVIREGMRVTNVNNTTNNTTIINNVTNVTNITNVRNVTIVAPPSATANGQAVNSSVPAQANLAAAMSPVVRVMAPTPASAKPIPAFVPGRTAISLPPAQVVHAEVPPHLQQRASEQPRPAMTAPNVPAHPATSPQAVNTGVLNPAPHAVPQPVPPNEGSHERAAMEQQHAQQSLQTPMQAGGPGNNRESVPHPVQARPDIRQNEHDTGHNMQEVKHAEEQKKPTEVKAPPKPDRQLTEKEKKEEKERMEKEKRER